MLCLTAASCSQKSPAAEAPTSVRRIPADLTDSRLELEGVFADGWTAPLAALTLFQPEGRRVLVIRGMIPKIDRDDFKTDLEVRLDNNVVTRESLGLGAFAVEAAVPPGAGKHRVGLAFSSVQLLPGGDGRAIGTRLSFAGFELPSATAAAGSDIVPRGASVRLGTGWHFPETVQGETFRAAANDAQLSITAAQSGNKRVILMIESGSPAQTVLQALDTSGRQVDAAEVGPRSSVNLFLPVEAGRDNTFRLHISENRAQPAFKVYRIEAY